MQQHHLAPSSVYSADTIAQFYAKGYWTDETLPDILDRRAAEAPDRKLVIDGDTVVTNAQGRAAAYRIAAALRSRGIAAGDCVAMQLPNWSEYIIAYFAVARLGAVLVPLMPIYRQKETEFIVGLTGARAYFATTTPGGFDHLAMIRELRGSLPQLEHVVSVRAPVASDEIGYDELVGTGDSVPDEAELGPRPDPDSGHIIGFTSGTESEPKGCFHTWNSYSFTPRMKRKIYDVTPDDVELIVSPPTHTSGLAAGVLKPLVSDAAMCLMPKWTPDGALELISRHRATMATGATPFVTMLADAYDPARHDVSSFRMFLCGGAPVPASAIARIRETLGVTRVLPVYGQTESLMVTTCRPDDSDERAATSSGYPIEGVEVAILDPDNVELPPGEIGEICYRTPGAMLGYWRRPEITERMIDSKGWRHSGDLGHQDESGYLQITGRLKDMLIRGGVNISAREVEDLVVQHPSVTAAAVVGIPDERLGERVGVFIAVTGEPPTLPELTEFLESTFRMAKQKLPEVLHVLDELPMTATGKVSKRELRAMLSPV